VFYFKEMQQIKKNIIELIPVGYKTTSVTSRSQLIQISNKKINKNKINQDFFG